MRTPKLVLAPLVLVAGLDAGVLVVAPNPGPGIDATSIQAAVDLAASGDTVLVRDGVYDPFYVASKGLHVLADGTNVRIRTTSSGTGATPSVSVFLLPFGEEVLIRGFTAGFGVAVDNCSGTVWFDDIRVRGGQTSGQCSGRGPGASIRNAAAVTFTSCSLVGDDGTPPIFVGGLAGAGATLLSSDVAFYDCVLIGGEGASSVNQGYAGGPGLELRGSSEALLSGTEVHGGPGGLTTLFPCTATHAPGGPGLSVSATNTVYAVESTASGGVADLNAICPGVFGPSGVDVSGAGTIVPLFGYARSLQTSSPVRGGTSMTFTASGQPGEIPLVLVSEGHQPVLLPSFSGSLLLGLPLTDTLVLPAASASGTAELTLSVPNVGASLGAAHLYVQALFLDAAGSVWIGGGSTVTLLDASY